MAFIGLGNNNKGISLMENVNFPNFQYFFYISKLNGVLSKESLNIFKRNHENIFVSYANGYLGITSDNVSVDDFYEKFVNKYTDIVEPTNITNLMSSPESLQGDPVGDSVEIAFTNNGNKITKTAGSQNFMYQVDIPIHESDYLQGLFGVFEISRMIAGAEYTFLQYDPAGVFNDSSTESVGLPEILGSNESLLKSSVESYNRPSNTSRYACTGIVGSVLKMPSFSLGLDAKKVTIQGRMNTIYKASLPIATPV